MNAVSFMSSYFMVLEIKVLIPNTMYMVLLLDFF